MMRDFFNPLRHPWFCLLLFSHRILRWAVPFILLIVFLANACLLDRPFYRLLFSGSSRSTAWRCSAGSSSAAARR